MIKIVLDTNILLQALAVKSRFRPIWNAFLNTHIHLYVITSILLEYEEILSIRTSSLVAFNVVSLIREAPNAFLTNIHYEWNVITQDVDDNKFFDTTVAANADYLVTNDAHLTQQKKWTSQEST